MMGSCYYVWLALSALIGLAIILIWRIESKDESSLIKSEFMPILNIKIRPNLCEDIRELIEGNYRIVYQVFEDRLVVLTVCEGHHLLPREKVDSKVSGTLYRRYFSVLSVIILTLMIAGCNTLSVKKVSPQDSGIMPSDEVMIFGRLRIIDNGEEKKQYQSFTDRHVITLVHFSKKQTQATTDVREDGTFIWKVPKGTYLLSRIRSWELRGFVDYYPQTAFLIDSGSIAHYLGTLQIDATIKRSPLGVYLEKYYVEIYDEFDKDADLLVNNMPNYQGQPTKTFMVHDSRLPETTISEINRDKQINLLKILKLVLQSF